MPTTLDETTTTALLDGLRLAAQRLAVPVDPSDDPAPIHADLSTLKDELAAATRSDADAETLLAAAAGLRARLAGFAERARVAAVARDGWLARDQVGPNPAAEFGRRDLSTSAAALRILDEALSTATGIPPAQPYSMYTEEGDAAVHAAVTALAALIASETLAPRAMVAAIADQVAAVEKTHPEVRDTEPEWDIVDALNPLLKRAGYRKISRDDI